MPHVYEGKQFRQQRSFLYSGSSAEGWWYFNAFGIFCQLTVNIIQIREKHSEKAEETVKIGRRRKMLEEKRGIYGIMVYCL